ASAYNFSAVLPDRSSLVEPQPASCSAAAHDSTIALRRQRGKVQEKVIGKRAGGKPESGDYRDAPRDSLLDDEGGAEPAADVETRAATVDAALHGGRLDKALVALAPEF